MELKVAPARQAVDKKDDAAAEPPITALSEGGQFLLWCIRHWTQAMRARRPVLEPLYAAHGVLGNPAIADQLDEMMSLVAVSAQRKIIVRCPCAKTAHPDEIQLLQFIRWLQADDETKAAAEVEHMILRKLVAPVVHSARLYAYAMATANMLIRPATQLRVVK